jgi:hypothetical protein
MAEPRQPPLPAAPDRPPGGGPPGDRRRLRVIRAVIRAPAVLAAVIAGTALLGVAAGFLWSAVAPRALVVVLGPGTPYAVNPETSAYIAADGWFTLLTVIGGVISGLLGYTLAVRRHGALAMAGVLVGGAVAALLAKWIGQQSGAAAYTRSLAAGRPGVLLHEPLMLGGLGALAFWPLAAGVIAGGIEAVILLRERRAASSPPQAAAPGAPVPADAKESSPEPGARPG